MPHAAREVRFASSRPSGAVMLEGALSLPRRDSAAPGIVICHPHPAGGGEMEVGLLRVLERRAARAGFAALRFNFGGVGRSEGAFTDGIEEPADVAAAHEYLRSRAEVDDSLVSVTGWSFGAWMSLMALAAGLPAPSCVAIAPPVMLYDWHPHVRGIAASKAARHYLVGANDQFCPQGFLESFASAVSEEDAGNITVMPSTDHYLVGREDIVSELAIDLIQTT